MDLSVTHVSGPPPIRFLSFLLDRRAAQLFDDGKAIALRPKTWAVLLYLAERPGVLVSSRELLDAVWGDVAVTPSTLTKSIGELRVALRDAARTPRCIETVHRRGFRFIAATSAVEPTTAEGTGWISAPAREAPFVGREREIECLSDAFRRATGGERQVVFVSGAPGLGKTALIERFIETLPQQATAHRVARGLCIQQRGTREPYMPVLDALAGLVRGPDGDTIAATLRAVAPTWFAQMPWLMTPAREAAPPSPPAGGPERMLRELGALSEALSAESTLVLVLEDLQWSDPSTIDLLSFVAQRQERARLLVLATHRPHEPEARARELPTTIRTLQVRQRCRLLTLHELSEDEVRCYVERRFPGASFARPLATKLHHYTGGNPLFLNSAVQHQLLRGWILETAPGWELAVPLEQWQLEVPDAARQIVELLLESLPPPDRLLLEAASVDGVEFSVRSVAAALAKSDEELEWQCDELVRLQWAVKPLGQRPWPDGDASGSYAFTHQIYQQIAYDQIPEARRQRWHQRVGEEIERAHRAHPAEVANRLAFHFDRSGDYPRAHAYFVAAAAQAQRRLANREAIGHLEDALARVPRLPAAQQAGAELRVRLAMVPVFSDLDGFASESVRRSLELAYPLAIAVGDQRQRFQILYSRCHLHWHRADRGAATALLAELDQLADSTADEGLRMMADSSLARAAFHAGHFADSCAFARRSIPPPAEAIKVELPFLHGTHPLVMAHCHAALAHWMMADELQAHELMQECLAAGDALQAPITVTGIRWFAGFLALLSGKVAMADEMARAVLQLAQESSFEYWRCLALIISGGVAVQRGLFADGIATLRSARSAVRATGGGLLCSHTLAFEAEALARSEQYDAAQAAIEQALALAESSADRSFWPELWRIHGEILAAAGVSRAAAEKSLRQAIELARASGATTLERRAIASMTRLTR